jgi:hypothetical protein
MNEALSSSETSVLTRTKWRNIPEGAVLLEAPSYAVFPLSLPFISYSQTPSVYVPPLMSETIFHIHTKPKASAVNTNLWH